MKKIKVYFCEITDLNQKKHQIKTDDEIKILSFMRQHKGKVAGVSPSLIAKLGRNENVTVEVLVKICEALECGMDEIMEIVPIEDRELKRG